MLGSEGQRRALSGLVTEGSEDSIVLLYRDIVLCQWPIDPGFPTLDNRDAGNPGRGAYVATWRATLPESMVLGGAATRVQVVNSAGLLVAQEDFSTLILKQEGKFLLVYINQHIR